MDVPMMKVERQSFDDHTQRVCQTLQDRFIAIQKGMWQYLSVTVDNAIQKALQHP